MNPVDTLAGFAARLREQMPCFPEFNPLARELFTLQFERNTPYREFCQSRGIAQSTISHWNEIPAVPAAAFKELQLSCIPAGERTTVFFSSGTTGQRPSRNFHHQKSLAVYEDSLLVWFGVHLLEVAPLPGSAGVSPASPAVRKSAAGRRDAGAPRPKAIAGPLFLRGLALTPPRADAPNSSLAHMFDTLRRAVGFTRFAFTGLTVIDGSWGLDCQATFEFLQDAIDANEPVVLLGTAFSYVHLLDHMAERKLNLRLPQGSRVLETGGYKGRSPALPKPDLHALIAAVLGVPPSHIVCEYGMSELSSQAYDRVAGLDEGAVDDELVPSHPAPLSRGFRFPPWVRIQIVSPETGREVQEGETGLIRVFDLANVYSVMAIQTEDLAVRRGADFELVGRTALAEPRGCSLIQETCSKIEIIKRARSG